MRVLIIFIEVILFFILRKELKRHLDYYYTKTRKSLIILVVCSVMYFGLHLLYLTKFPYINRNKEKILITETTRKYKGYEPLLWMLFDFVWNIPLYTLFYYNIQNIDFERYLEDIMNGLGIEKHFQDASIFIKVKQINDDISFSTEKTYSGATQSLVKNQDSPQSHKSLATSNFTNDLDLITKSSHTT